MRDWSAMLLGAVIGAAAAIYYLGNERELMQRTRQVKARSKRTLEAVNSFGTSAGEILRR